MEIAVAAFLPVAIAVVAGRVWGDEKTRAAIERLFLPATLIWFAPCWLLGKSPVAFDYLSARLLPWSATTPRGFASGNALLSDVPLQFVPWRDVVTSAWRSGTLPFLNPFAGGGSPIWENPQAAVLSPFTIAGLVFSSFAWPLFASVSKTMVAMVGTYLFVRGEGATDAGARFGAIAYAFGTFSVAFLLFPHTNVTVFTPWFLFAIRRAIDGANWRATGGATIVLLLQFVGGHPETVLHVALISIPYAAWRIWRSDRARRARGAGRVIVLGLLGLSLAAPLLVPFAAYLPSMERFERVRAEQRLGAAPPVTFETLSAFVAPGRLEDKRGEFAGALNFNESGTGYIGISAFALALAAAISTWRSRAFWVVALGLGVFLAFDVPLVARVVERLPVIGSGMHGRIRFVLALILALLAASAFEYVQDARFRRVAMISLAGVLVLALAMLMATPASFVIPAFRRNAIALLTAVVLAALLARGRTAEFARFAPALLFLDLFSMMGNYNPATGREFFYPKTGAIEAMGVGMGLYRVVGIDETLLPNSSAMFGLQDLRVHDPAAYEPYVEFLERAGFDRRYYFNQFHELPPRVLLDFLGVRRVIAPPQSAAVGFPEVYRGGDGVVFDNPAALPRFFVPSDVRRVADPFAAFRRERNAASVSLLPGPPIPLSTATLTVVTASNHERALRVEARRQTFIASSEIAVPGWELTWNGKPWPIERVNSQFVGWRVPAGGGTFDLCYEPRGFRVGLALAAVALAALLWILFAAARFEVDPTE